VVEVVVVLVVVVVVLVVLVVEVVALVVVASVCSATALPLAPVSLVAIMLLTFELPLFSSSPVSFVPLSDKSACDGPGAAQKMAQQRNTLLREADHRGRWTAPVAIYARLHGSKQRGDWPQFLAAVKPWVPQGATKATLP